MARYGEDRPWEGREGERDWDRWRREQEMSGRRGYEPGGEYGARGEGWREEDRGRWAESRREWPEWRGSEYEGRRWAGMRDPRWEREWGRRYEPQRRDRPWVEPSPQTVERGATRGLYEWEDRGPLAWIREKTGELKSRKAGRGPKGYTRTDERIEDDVCERIARSGIDADEIEVKVENREVTLTGNVWSREDKWWLESVVEDVYGVEDVHNRLRVGRESRGLGASERAAEKRDLPH